MGRALATNTLDQAGAKLAAGRTSWIRASHGPVPGPDSGLFVDGTACAPAQVFLEFWILCAMAYRTSRRTADTWGVGNGKFFPCPLLNEPRRCY